MLTTSANAETLLHRVEIVFIVVNSKGCREHAQDGFLPIQAKQISYFVV